MAKGQLHWENRNLTTAENLKLVMARKPTLSSSVLVVYPRLNQGEWVSPSVHSQHKLDSVVGGGLQGQWKIYSTCGVFNSKNKRNLSEPDSENETADFSRFIVIESSDEVSPAKPSSFLIEKVIKQGYTEKNVKKTRNRNLLVEVDSQRLPENLLKMKIFLTTKCNDYPYEKLNTSRVIRSRECCISIIQLHVYIYKYMRKRSTVMTTSTNEYTSL